jgi:carbonic anhydrase
VVGLLSGVPLQVSGPSVVSLLLMASWLPEFGWPTVCLITVGAGVLQAFLGIFKLADGVLAISPGVVRGLLVGIGVGVVWTQVHELISGAGVNVMLGLIPVASALLWRCWSGQRIAGALVGVVVATVASMAMPMAVMRIGTLGPWGGIGLALPREVPWTVLMLPMLTLALVAGMESLVCADKLRGLRGAEAGDLDQELSAQGVGNVVSGLLGGLPISGGIMSSMANLRGGAKSRWSVVMQGGWVLLGALVMGPWVSMIPQAVVAGLLILAGLSLVEGLGSWKSFTVRDRILYGVTLLGVCVCGVPWGFGIGMGGAVIMKMQRLGRTEVEVEMRNGS